MEYFLDKKITTIFFRLIISLVFVLFIFLGLIYFSNSQSGFNNSSFRDKIFEFSDGRDYSKVFLKIDGKIIEAELVFGREAMYLGLSGRDNLEPNKGMLFVFDNYGYQTFLMRNMNFPIDIIFLKNGEVMKVFSNLAPEGASPENFYQYGPVDMVIELPENYFRDNDLKEGMVFELISSGA